MTTLIWVCIIIGLIAKFTLLILWLTRDKCIHEWQEVERIKYRYTYGKNTYEERKISQTEILFKCKKCPKFHKEIL